MGTPQPPQSINPRATLDKGTHARGRILHFPSRPHPFVPSFPHALSLELLNPLYLLAHVQRHATL
jgi:hypothetical protein